MLEMLPRLVDRKAIPPDLKVLYFLSLRDFLGERKRSKLNQELGINKLEQDTSGFQNIARRLSDENLVALRGSFWGANAKTENGASTRLDQIGIAKGVDYLELTNKGRKTIAPLVVGNKTLVLLLVAGVAGAVSSVYSWATIGLSGTALFSYAIESWALLVLMGYSLWTFAGQRKLLTRFGGT